MVAIKAVRRDNSVHGWNHFINPYIMTKRFMPPWFVLAKKCFACWNTFYVYDNNSC